MNENVTHSLKPAAAARRRTARSSFQPPLRLGRHGRQRRERRRQTVVAEVAGDLFDQVHIARHVDPPRRHGHHPAGVVVLADEEAEARQDPADLRDRHRRAEHLRDARQRPAAPDAGLAASGLASIQPRRTVPAPICSSSAQRARQRLRAAPRNPRRARSDTTLPSTARASCWSAAPRSAGTTRSRSRWSWSPRTPRCRRRPSRPPAPARAPRRR